MARKAKTQPEIDSANSDENSSGTTRRQRRSRPRFELESALDASGNAIPLDEDGRLTGVPANWEAPAAKLKRNQFSTRELYYDYLLMLNDRQIRSLNERRQELIDAREGNVDETAKARKQIERLRKKLALLEAQVDSDDDVE